MHIPPQYRQANLDAQHDLIRTHSFGHMICNGPDGIESNSIPFILDSESSEFGTLRGHLGRANPQADYLSSTDECLVIFQGPHAYVTPTWYTSKKESGKAVPTWDHITVHVYGKPKIINDREWLFKSIDELSTEMEKGRPEPWKLSDAPESYLNIMVKSIIGIEIEITRIQAQWKLSQNLTTEDMTTVVSEFKQQGENGRNMAILIEEAHKGKLKK
ncbi:FMN-binding negative transcriptional regulator [Nadsonia fulvescens var. elongata DSM 6958]|uniref:FMN-binding negative transcriptional regulator n=1 Tax=Nadsonia fulvescens var. elongata DSM 6958 TaxID=857566 RepID=A0A1E3PGK7_9ASCO|nr:FMN-binding negative transcriptional regulator [Nadsonia fulvescens var. elongata DSM 6958]